MNDIEVLWQEMSRLSINIPETLVIKDKKIKSWLYTSSVNSIQKGQIMKHRRQTITFSKILESFSSTQFSFTATYTSEAKTTNLTLSEFELVLLSINDFSCEPSFLIQKYIPADSQVHVLLNFITESITVPTSISDSIQETLIHSRTILKFLSYSMPTLFSAELFWTVHSKVPYLYTLTLKHKTETRIRCSSARSHKPPTIPIMIKKPSRPVTANHRRDSITSARSHSTYKQLKASTETQTDPIEACSCEETYLKLTEQLNLILKENEKIEKKIAETLQSGKTQLKLAEEKWKERSLEITKAISEKFFGELTD